MSSRKRAFLFAKANDDDDDAGVDTTAVEDTRRSSSSSSSAAAIVLSGIPRTMESLRKQIRQRMGSARFQPGENLESRPSMPLCEETAARLDELIKEKEMEPPSRKRTDDIVAAKEREDREREAMESAMRLMRPLTSEERDVVIGATRGIGPPKEILASQDADSVHRGSMHTLRPGQWLNDEVINYFLKICLAKRDKKLCAREPGRRRSYFFNSFFMQTIFDEKNNDPNLRRRYNFENVRRWSKKVPGKDIFNLKYIIYPINLDNMHWTSAVIFMEEKKIQYYDSLGGTRWSKLIGLLEYVKDEYRAKNGKDMDVSDWKLVSCSKGTPRQRNGELYFFRCDDNMWFIPLSYYFSFIKPPPSPHNGPWLDFPLFSFCRL
jgi:hypothetical protein